MFIHSDKFGAILVKQKCVEDKVAAYEVRRWVECTFLFLHDQCDEALLDGKFLPNLLRLAKEAEVAEIVR